MRAQLKVFADREISPTPDEVFQKRSVASDRIAINQLSEQKVRFSRQQTQPILKLRTGADELLGEGLCASNKGF